MNAKEIDEKERIGAINSLIEACVKRGRIDDAQKAAKLAGRELTRKEIDSLVMACIKMRWGYGIEKAIKLAGRGFTKEEIDSFVEVLITKEKKQEKYRGEALKAARLGASKEVLNSLVKFYIERGEEGEAREAAKLAGREFTKEENEAMLRFDIKYGYLSSAQRNAQQIGRKLTRKEIDSLIAVCFKKAFSPYQTAPSDFNEISKIIVELGASKETINSLAKALAEDCIKDCIKIGLICHSLKLAELRGRPLSTEEIDSLVRGCISPAQIYEYSLREKAFEAAKLGASKEAIESLVGACIKKGWLSEAREAAKLAERELTIEEIEKLREITLKK